MAVSTIASFARLQPFLKEGTVFRDLGLKRFITNKLTRSGVFLVWYKPIVLSLVEMLTRHCVWPLCEADRMHLAVEALFRVQLHIKYNSRCTYIEVGIMFSRYKRQGPAPCHKQRAGTQD